LKKKNGTRIEPDFHTNKDPLTSSSFAAGDDIFSGKVKRTLGVNPANNSNNKQQNLGCSVNIKIKNKNKK